MPRSCDIVTFNLHLKDRIQNLTNELPTTFRVWGSSGVSVRPGLVGRDYIYACEVHQWLVRGQSRVNE